MGQRSGGRVARGAESGEMGKWSPYGLPQAAGDMERRDAQAEASLDQGYQAFALHYALIENTDAVVRLTDSHYLVRWQPETRLWCVINMLALDEHADICSEFRYLQRCEHLDLICQLCAREQNRC